MVVRRGNLFAKLTLRPSRYVVITYNKDFTHAVLEQRGLMLACDAVSRVRTQACDQLVRNLLRWQSSHTMMRDRRSQVVGSSKYMGQVQARATIAVVGLRWFLIIPFHSSLQQ